MPRQRADGVEKMVRESRKCERNEALTPWQPVAPGDELRHDESDLQKKGGLLFAATKVLPVFGCSD